MALSGGGHAYVGVPGRWRACPLAGAPCSFDGTYAANAAKGRFLAPVPLFVQRRPAGRQQRLASWVRS
jgi:hypothetical protein